MKYNHLVMNLIILHEAHNVTIVLGSCGKKRGAGAPKVLARLARLSLYRRAHIDRFGECALETILWRAHAELRVSTSIPLLSQGPLQAHDSCKYSSSYHQQPEIIYAGKQRSLLGKLLRKL